MTTPAVKFCGMTRREDAWRAAELGAAAVGFVFWRSSPRAVSADAARAIVRTLPPFVKAVGVFVDAPAAEVHDVVAHVGLDAVQLHGRESPEYAAGLSRKVLKAIAGTAEDLLSAAATWPGDVTVLVDAVDPVRRGGTGQSADWPGAAVLARQRPIVLAGGLTPENVADAIHAVHPYAVDVASGVEHAPGAKDHHRMRLFMEAVANAPALNPLIPLIPLIP